MDMSTVQLIQTLIAVYGVSCIPALVLIIRSNLKDATNKWDVEHIFKDSITYFKAIIWPFVLARYTHRKSMETLIEYISNKKGF